MLQILTSGLHPLSAQNFSFAVETVWDAEQCNASRYRRAMRPQEKGDPLI